MKIVINQAYGGFCISDSFYDYYGISQDPQYPNLHEKIERTDKRLIEYIEKFGSEKASGRYARLAILEIPNGTKYRITEYDGYESVETIDNIEWQIATDNE